MHRVVPWANLAALIEPRAQQAGRYNQRHLGQAMEEAKHDAVFQHCTYLALKRKAFCHSSTCSLTGGRRFDEVIDTAWLRQLEARVVSMTCTVIDSVAVMGWRFPGGAGPGKDIWSK